MKKTALPVQYDFDSNWLTEIVAKRKEPEFAFAFEVLQEHLVDLAKWVYDDEIESGFDQELAEGELMLSTLSATVKCYDLHWIREKMDELAVTEFVRALAHAIVPEKKWIILDDGFDFGIVTDTERTMVFDLINCQHFSAATSLVLAQDPDFKAPASALQEAILIRKNWANRQEVILQNMKAELDQFKDRRGLSVVPDLVEDENP